MKLRSGRVLRSRSSRVFSSSSTPAETTQDFNTPRRRLSPRNVRRTSPRTSPRTCTSTPLPPTPQEQSTLVTPRSSHSMCLRARNVKV